MSKLTEYISGIFNSLTFKLYALIIIVISLFFSIAFSLTYRSTRKTSLSFAKSEFLSSSQLISQQLNRKYELRRGDEVQEYIEDLKARKKSILDIEVFDRKSVIIASLTEARRNAVYRDPVIASVMKSNKGKTRPTLFFHRDAGGKREASPAFAVITPIAGGNAVEARGAVVVYYSVEEPIAIVNQVLRNGIIQVVLSVALVVLVLSVAIRRMILRPIMGMRRIIGKIEKGDLDDRCHITQTDEIGELQLGINSMITGLRERDLVKDTFGRYTSPEVADMILKGDVVLGGDRINVTTMFLDVRGFTPFAESTAPEQVVEFLNSFFTDVVEIITNHGGTVDKFIGDAVLAVFGAPISAGSEKEDALNAARAAWEIKKQLSGLEAARLFHGGNKLRIGIGIHTGEIVAGNIGSEKHTEYTIVGHSVNIASRVESANKELGTMLLMTEATSKLVGSEFRLKAAGKLKLKGVVEEMELFEIARKR